ncbi:SIR2 family protein [Oryzomonas rubra]|uniref:NAD(+) hydrolase ThsA n=1 Tax=Oryzomonas rubra TaxID=2509454 RepID=A0A5A9XME9_9BACT|nr:SIR2 family protein [Oryzomonas rubra]KAA0894256.1 hypothetical protein ET418_04695 [Oryzomonas rubra]
MDRQIASFIKHFAKEVKENNAAIFAGAGLSVAAGFVDWKTLLKPLADDLGLDIRKEDNLVSLAQYHCNEKGRNRHRINQLLIDEFSRNATLTENHRILARLPITTYWTTNYDKLIEKALEAVHKVPDVKYTVKQLANTRPKRDAVVYKMHGDVDHPAEAVLIKEDYEKYHIDFVPYIAALTGDLVSKTFLFLGFSFTDPNIDYVLSRIRATYTEHQREHFCIMRRISRSECLDEADYEYKVRKQELFINDLKRYNVTTLLIDEFAQITEILWKIERIYKVKTVFISGSAHEYGAMGKDNGEKLVHEISSNLIRRDFKIVSGYGLGMGTAVINGAMEEIYSSAVKARDEQILVRPFPQNKTGIAVWDEYRKDMISLAGIAIFMFGNKLDGGNVVLANGVRREFEIALENGLYIVPIGATGYMAAELWKEVSAGLDKYYPGHSKEFDENFTEIGDPALEPDELVDSVMRLLDKIIRR